MSSSSGEPSSDHEDYAPVPVVPPTLEPDPSIKCLCNSQLDNQGMMLCCDGCDMWSHAVCYSISPADVPQSFFCKNCRPSAVAPPAQAPPPSVATPPTVASTIAAPVPVPVAVPVAAPVPVPVAQPVPVPVPVPVVHTPAPPPPVAQAPAAAPFPVPLAAPVAPQAGADEASRGVKRDREEEPEAEEKVSAASLLTGFAD